MIAIFGREPKPATLRQLAKRSLEAMFLAGAIVGVVVGTAGVALDNSLAQLSIFEVRYYDSAMYLILFLTLYLALLTVMVIRIGVDRLEAGADPDPAVREVQGGQ